MTNEEFLVIMQKILATKENRELFLQWYFDYTKNILKPKAQTPQQNHHKIRVPKLVNYERI